jgi:hypothetical protein
MDPSYLLPRARKGPKHRHSSKTGWAAQLRHSPGSGAAAACVLILLTTVILVRSDSSSVYRDARRIGLTFHRRHQQQSLQTAAELRQQEQGYQQWLSTFKASDPAFQDYCMQVLLNSTRFELQGAQHSQDVFLFRNLYKFWPMQGRKGFYIESGANDPFYLSTSLFFDKCLGWDGLCVEPQAKFHEVSLADSRAAEQSRAEQRTAGHSRAGRSLLFSSCRGVFCCLTQPQTQNLCGCAASIVGTQQQHSLDAAAGVC